MVQGGVEPHLWQLDISHKTGAAVVLNQLVCRGAGINQGF